MANEYKFHILGTSDAKNIVTVLYDKNLPYEYVARQRAWASDTSITPWNSFYNNVVFENIPADARLALYIINDSAYRILSSHDLGSFFWYEWNEDNQSSPSDLDVDLIKTNANITSSRTCSSYGDYNPDVWDVMSTGIEIIPSDAIAGPINYILLSERFHVFTNEDDAITYIQTGIDNENIISPGAATGMDWKLFINIKTEGYAKKANYTLTWQPNAATEIDDNGLISLDFYNSSGIASTITSDVYTSITFTSDYIAQIGNVVDIVAHYNYNDILTMSIGCSLYPDNLSAFDDDVTVGEYVDTSTFSVVFGIPNEDDTYKPPTESGDDLGGRHDGNSSLSLLTTTYATTIDMLQQLGNELWTDDFISNIKLINNNPIENIISVKLLPHAITFDSPTTPITIGNVSFSAGGVKLSNSFSLRKTLGQINIPEYYHSFLDYAPFTKITIYLPYIGLKDLDTNMVMGHTLSVDYVFDYILGMCKAIIFVDGTQLVSYDGSIGIDIPITASNRSEVELGYINSIFGTASTIASGNVVGTVNNIVDAATNSYHYDTNGSSSPCIASYETNQCFLIYDRPIYREVAIFNHTKGKMCNLTLTIGSLSGFTIADNVDMSDIPCTDIEKDLIKSILESGFYA